MKTPKKGRKGPSESATKFQIGTVKIGNDGGSWIVKKNKNGVQRWSKKTDSESTINVFYNVNPEDIEVSKYWTYGKFPGQWWWVGAGSTVGLGSAGGNYGPPGYKLEEQFNGDNKNMNNMKKYLTKYFDKLLKQKILLKYKITSKKIKQEEYEPIVYNKKKKRKSRGLKYKMLSKHRY